MSLDKDAFEKAIQAFYANGEMLEFAIEAYLAEMFKPGQLTMLEPIRATQTARDYRKELWIEVALKDGCRRADSLLSVFDETFPKEQP